MLLLVQQIKDFYETTTHKTRNDITPSYVREHTVEIIMCLEHEIARREIDLFETIKFDGGKAEYDEINGEIAWYKELITKLKSLNAITKDQAKNLLLDKLYFCRNKSTAGGYEAWKRLLDMYFSFEYTAMHSFIADCRGTGGKTRAECLELIEIILED